jgi:Tol biopolymer transport system component
VTLAAGTKLGPYEILSPLGAGGMGEVYRARDARLNREVAVKVLPESLASQPEALSRFEREAKAVAALNHPNILSIHDFGSEDGVAYAATELLEGESLRTRLEGGAMTQRRAVEVAIQIAKGLAAAHEKGVIHRDLKPENLFLTRDGRVKILDFGLAKVFVPERAATSAPTAAAQTEPGTVMGTVGYMSPEQVLGRDVDPRTDIFSFGAVLYEMLSGERAFKRNSAVETMNAILKEDPPELSDSGRIVSPVLDRIVRHCLEKSPESRFHSAGDVAFDLEAVSTSTSAPGRAVSGVRGRSAHGRVPALLAATAGIFLAAGFWLGGRRSHPPVRFVEVTRDNGIIAGARFAPDGQTVAYGAAWRGGPFRVYLARTGSPESTPIPTPDAALFSVSSKGELAIALDYRMSGWVGSGQLARVPLLGGTPRPIVDAVLAADWDPEGNDLAVVRRVGAKHRLEYPIGKVLYETSGWISHIRFSRDGKRIAFANHPIPKDDRGTVDVVDLAGNRKVLTKEFASVQGIGWSARGDEIWFSADPGEGGRPIYGVTTGGRLRTVLASPGVVFLCDVASDGRILLTREERTIQTILFPEGGKERDLSWLGDSFAQDFPPGDRSVLTTYVGDEGGNNYSVYIRPTDGSPAARLGEGGGLSFSPDGKWVVALIYTPSAALVLYPTGAGQSRSIPIDVAIETGSWVSERTVVVVGARTGHTRQAFRVDLDAAKPHAVAITPEGLQTTGGPYAPPTPDGSEVTLVGPDGRLMLYPVAGGTPRPVPGWREGDLPVRFSSDGRTLFVSRDELPVRLEQIDLATGARRTWRQFDVADPSGLQTSFLPVVMSGDGRAVACNYSRRLSHLFLGEGIR